MKFMKTKLIYCIINTINYSFNNSSSSLEFKNLGKKTFRDFLISYFIF